MRVEYPQNINDEDIPTDGRNAMIDSSTPTSMSFFLQQIRLADICRTITDQSPCFLDPFQDPDYESIFAMDAMFQSFLDDLPAFFRLDASGNRIRTEDKRIIYQRNLLHMELHIRRCKLHQPSLCRGDSDPECMRSRRTCLSSAFTVLEISRLAEMEDSAPESFTTRLGAIVQYIFTAAMILVLELSYNNQAYRQDHQFGTNSQQGAQHRAAIMEACAMLERAAIHSLMARNFLNTFTQILRRHRVTGLAEARNATAAEHGSSPWLAQSNAAPVELPQQASSAGSGALDALLQDYVDFGSSFKAPMWQGLFADLESWCHFDPSAG